jgi:alpha-glucosidase (family GH31 glycosyl hydrolase)
MCGDCLLVAPVTRAGSRGDVYLPRGNDWIDLASGVRHCGGEVLSRMESLDTLPHFGRVGYALPLGHEVRRADDIDRSAPLDEVWLFGEQSVERRGFAQLRYMHHDGVLRVSCAGGRVRQLA